MNTEILQENIRSRLDAIAKDAALWFDLPKEEALEWLNRLLIGEAEPYREVGVDMNWRSE